jgi:hypothetical protein
MLMSDGATVAETKTDAAGTFSVQVPPGRYDIHIIQSVMFGARIKAADLHEGQQAIPPLTAHFNYGQNEEGIVTEGGAMVISRCSVRYAVMHPLR